MMNYDGSVEEPAKCNEDGIFRPKVCDEVKDMGYECKPLYVAASYQATCLVALGHGRGSSLRCLRR